MDSGELFTLLQHDFAVPDRPLPTARLELHAGCQVTGDSDIETVVHTFPPVLSVSSEEALIHDVCDPLPALGAEIGLDSRFDDVKSR